MKRLTSFPLLLRGRPRQMRRAGFTIAEMMIALSIGVFVAGAVLAAMISSGIIIRDVTNEIVSREDLGRTLRQIAAQMRQASSIVIHDYYASVPAFDPSTGAVRESEGRFVYIQNNPTATPQAFYLVAPADAPDGVGRLYHLRDANNAPDPGSDRLLASKITDFDIQWEQTANSEFVHLEIVADFRSRAFEGTAIHQREKRNLRFTMSVLPRTTTALSGGG